MQHEHFAIDPEDALDVIKVANVITRSSLKGLQVSHSQYSLDKFLGTAGIEIYGSDIDSLNAIKDSIDEIYQYYSMTNPEREDREDQEEDDDLDTTTIEDFDSGFDFFTFICEKIKEYYTNNADITREYKPLWSENVNFAHLITITV